jgi:cation diffusion facilitator CzcD-associated flavoprotein CzcO
MGEYYDLIIIGAGPCGLAIGQCCSKIGIKILVIDQNDSIGGCYRVTRIKVNNEQLFTEHAPRIYSSAYLNFITLLMACLI